MKKFSARTIVEPAVFAAIICILAPFSLPIGPVPISLASFAIYLVGGMQKPLRALIAVCVYILIGIVGVPVFANFMGGFERIAAPAGGFIIGYIPCVLLTSFILSLNRKVYMYPIAMVCGTVVLYACGLGWFMISMNTTLGKALAVTVLPFIAFDAVKIVIASVISFALYDRVFRDNSKKGIEG